MTNAYDRYKAIDAELELLNMWETKLKLKTESLLHEKGALWWKMHQLEREEADKYFLAKVRSLHEAAGIEEDEYEKIIGLDQKSVN